MVEVSKEPEFEEMTDEEALAFILGSMTNDEVEARFILALSKGETEGDVGPLEEDESE